MTDTNGHFLVIMVLPKGSPLIDPGQSSECKYQIRVYNTTKESYLDSIIISLLRTVLDKLYETEEDGSGKLDRHSNGRS